MNRRRELSYTSAKALFSKTAHPHPLNMIQTPQGVARGGTRF